jgi:transcription-repair coupling factor (superfamily II helicase)
VGYELYCALLEKTVRELKQLPPRDVVDVTIDLPVAAYFPEAYLPDMRTKIDLYRRLARIASEGELADLQLELNDRFGPPPAPVEELVELARLRVWAHRRRIDQIHLEGWYAVLTYADRTELEKLRDRSGGHLRVADERSAYLPLASEDPGAILARLKALLRQDADDS